jgi:16S rRNA (uracil1498-N3)-methyltransferase
LTNLEKAPGLKVILWEQETSRDLKGLLEHYGPRIFTGMVGPEGGFTPEEVSRAQHAGFIPVSMGNRILRAETAALVLVAIVQYEWGDLHIG